MEKDFIRVETIPIDVELIFTDIQNISFDHITDDNLSFDKWDWIMIVISGSIGALCDLVIGHNKGMKEPKIKNDSLFGLGEHLRQYDLKNNPIDFQEPGAFGGNHRLYSNGHDLFRFLDGVRQTMVGDFVGISSVGWGEMTKQFPGYQQLDFKTALIVNLLHLFKDFCTVRSLPIPGMSLLANINGNKMPAFAESLYIDHGFNLRILTGQVLSVASIELILRVYNFIRYINKDVSKAAIHSKRNKMLLIAHSFAMLFNVGKVVLTKNPFLLNIPQLLMIGKYCFQLLKESFDAHKHLISVKSLSFNGRGIQLAASFNNTSIIDSIHNSYEESINDIAKLNEDRVNVNESNVKVTQRVDEIVNNYSEALRLLKQKGNKM